MFSSKWWPCLVLAAARPLAMAECGFGRSDCEHTKPHATHRRTAAGGPQALAQDRIDQESTRLRSNFSLAADVDALQPVPPAGAAKRMHAVTIETFFLVGSAEIFDKTFFIAMVLAMQHRMKSGTVFTGCFTSLAVHVLLAAAFGYAISALVAPRVLDLAAALLYFIFACLYAKDYYFADGDSMCEFQDTKEELAGATTDAYGSCEAALEAAKGPRLSGTSMMSVFSIAFTTTFIGEFGDRTQIAMIGQHASQPLVPVCVGSMAAFLVLCSSAVIAGTFLSDCAVTERQVCLIGGISFALFSVVSLRSALVQQ
mmetsp:Transcript_116160/g.328662  ORF Transcript_116160/g.328662 Transcript_116160/m.328662 type:complete len:313 (+) Transcript_116160:58-996(+)